MRRLFGAAVLVFAVASLGCAMSGGFAQLLVWRVVQGFAGGMLIPAVFAAVFLLFPLRLQARATTIAGLLAVLAPTVGPIAGGWITETYSWHWLFLINVGPGLAAALGGLALLPRERPDEVVSRSFDLFSLVLLATGLAALEIALKEAPHRGWFSPVVIGLLAWTMIAGAILSHRAVHGERPPLVDLTLLADRDFAIGSVLSFLLGVGLFGSVYLMPVFLAYVRGHDALDIGKTMLVTGVAQLVTAPIVVELGRRVDARLLAAFGFALFALGLGLSARQSIATDFQEMIWPQICAASPSCSACCRRRGLHSVISQPHACPTQARSSTSCAISVGRSAWRLPTPSSTGALPRTARRSWCGLNPATRQQQRRSGSRTRCWRQDPQRSTIRRSVCSLLP